MAPACSSAATVSLGRTGRRSLERLASSTISSMPPSPRRAARRGARAMRSEREGLARPSAQASSASPPATIRVDHRGSGGLAEQDGGHYRRQRDDVHAEAPTRRPGRREGAGGHPGGPAALGAAPRRREHDVAGGPRLRPAPGALPWAGQDGAAERRHHRRSQPRPLGRLVQRTTARAHSHLAVCCPHSVPSDFANSVRRYALIMALASHLGRFRTFCIMRSHAAD